MRARGQGGLVLFLLKRTLLGLVVALCVSAVLFIIVPLAGGDPARLAAGGNEATIEQVEAARIRLGLDRPIFVRYGEWMSKAVKGDLGDSIFIRQPVSSSLARAIPVTVTIMLLASALSILIGIPSGIIVALHPGSRLSRILEFATSLGIATPHFFAGLLLVRLFALSLGWLPSVGFPPTSISAILREPIESLRFAILPGAALAIGSGSALARYTAASFTDVFQKEYVRTAEGKGLSSRVVLFKHVMKNALIPVVTFQGLELRRLLGGSVAVETVFAVPGIGTLAVRAILNGDYPVVLGISVFALAVVLVTNILVDASYSYLNPQVRLS